MAVIIDFITKKRIDESNVVPNNYEQMSKIDLMAKMAKHTNEIQKRHLSKEEIINSMHLFKELTNRAETVEFKLFCQVYLKHLQITLNNVK